MTNVPFVSGAKCTISEMHEKYPIYLTNYSALQTNDLREFLLAFVYFCAKGDQVDTLIKRNLEPEFYTFNADPNMTMDQANLFFSAFAHSMHIVFTTYAPQTSAFETHMMLSNTNYQRLVCSEHLNHDEAGEIFKVMEANDTKSDWYIKASFADSQITNVIGIRDIDTMNMSPVELMVLKDTASCTDNTPNGLNSTEYHIKRQLFAELCKVFLNIHVSYYRRSMTSYFKLIAMEELYYKTTGKILRMRYSEDPPPKKTKEYRAYTKYMKTLYTDLLQITRIIRETRTHAQAVLYSARRLKNLIDDSAFVNRNVDYLNMTIPAYEQCVEHVRQETLLVAQHSHDLALKAGASIISPKASPETIAKE